MAIDLVTFRNLLRIARDEQVNKSSALVLGRQDFLLPSGPPRMERQKRIYQDLLNQAGYSESIENLIDQDGYCDTLFAFLGFENTDYMDISDYEGANVIHDLSEPVPDSLYEKYDFIMDGGTVEHIFNVPRAFENLHRMLKPEGRLFALNPANNWVGHGFYQFSPDIAWSFWRDAMGYEVKNCRITAMRDWYGRHEIVTPSPEEREYGRDHSLRSLSGDGIFLLVYEVVKKEKCVGKANAQQSDYRATWDASSRGEKTSPP